MINYTEVKDIIKRKLIGIHMTNIGRAADMLWIQYGNFITAKNYKGEEVRKSEYAIHVQGPWSFMQNENILLSSNDILELGNKKGEKQLKEDNVLFDDKCEKFIKKVLPVTVRDVDISEDGSLNILLSKNLRFQAITDKNKKNEYWRFIDNNKKEHLVIFEEF
ncbi:hypothetical protein [Acetivibrio saccincola]|uniref:Uncharacterized protein n=1 Tax=Acetivibrio saccincola TaxID=1677857 RepID=A0A2K9DZ13_9FIRM|nr:hypothetical protein [Acetivibrio saccincola]AUG56732.1 hypothetical protein HVS_03935 [Acetivibrio saccincola]